MIDGFVKNDREGYIPKNPNESVSKKLQLSKLLSFYINWGLL